MLYGAKCKRAYKIAQYTKIFIFKGLDYPLACCPNGEHFIILFVHLLVLIIQNLFIITIIIIY